MAGSAEGLVPCSSPRVGTAWSEFESITAQYMKAVEGNKLDTAPKTSLSILRTRARVARAMGQQEQGQELGGAGKWKRPSQSWWAQQWVNHWALRWAHQSEQRSEASACA